MSPTRSARRASRVFALLAILGLVGAACQPGTPAVIPTAGMQMAIDGYSYSATSPLWQLDVPTGSQLQHPSSQFGLTLRDPTGTGGIPLSGVFHMWMWLDTGGPLFHPGTYSLEGANPDLEVSLGVATLEDFIARQDITVPSEIRWACGDRGYYNPTVTNPSGTITITSVAYRGDAVASIGLSWDFTCTSIFRDGTGDFSTGISHHWVGSASYNS